MSDIGSLLNKKRGRRFEPYRHLAAQFTANPRRKLPQVPSFPAAKRSPSVSSQCSAYTLHPRENVRRYLATLGSPEPRVYLPSDNAQSPLGALEHPRSSETHAHHKRQDDSIFPDAKRFIEVSNDEEDSSVGSDSCNILWSCARNRIEDDSSNDEEQGSTSLKEASSEDSDAEDGKVASEYDSDQEMTQYVPLRKQLSQQRLITSQRVVPPKVKVYRNASGTTIFVDSENHGKYDVSIRAVQRAARKLQYVETDEILSAIEDLVMEFKPSVLIIGYEWLINNTLPGMSAHDDKAAIHTAFQLVDLYNIARQFDARGLQNGVMNRFTARETCDDGYFSRSLIRKAYDYADTRSKLRRYAVDTFLYKAQKWEEGKVDKWLDLHIKDGNQQFVADVREADRLLVLRGKSQSNPNNAAQCRYHFHLKGHTCAIDN